MKKRQANKLKKYGDDNFRMLDSARLGLSRLQARHNQTIGALKDSQKANEIRRQDREAVRRIIPEQLLLDGRAGNGTWIDAEDTEAMLIALYCYGDPTW